MPRVSLFSSQHSASGAKRQPIRQTEELNESKGLTRKIDVEEGFPFSKPPYAALWKSSIWRIQLVSGFHLGQIWSTISKSLILND